MKRIGKILLASAMVLALCLCLCSCAALDEMKTLRAEVRGSDTGEKTILFRDSVYRPAGLSYTGQMSLHVSFSDTAYVADPDVPLLLLSRVGISCPFNKDASVLEYNGDYYIREDRYDDLRALLDGSGPHAYCTEERDETYTQNYPLLPAEYTELLDTLTALADSGSYLPEDSGDLVYAFSRHFFRCNGDASFLTSSYTFVRLSKDGTGDRPSETTYLYNYDSDRAVKIPEEYLPAVDQMIEDVRLFEFLW